jgi:hypothetical protein
MSKSVTGTASMDFVYHFTDSAGLPWILRSGELRPGSNKIGGFPDPDFLWATTDPRGDGTASAMRGYRRGGVRLVRFTLHAHDFEPWRVVVGRFPAWTSHQIRLLEQIAKSSTETWRCRTEPLPKSSWVTIDTRTYVDKAWRPFDAPVVDGEDGYIGVEIGGKFYFSRKEKGPQGASAYSVITAMRANDPEGRMSTRTTT